jgi:hypothetical protein
MLGSWLRRRRRGSMNVSVAALLAFLFTPDHSYRRLISDTVTIKAPPERVWRYVFSLFE